MKRRMSGEAKIGSRFLGAPVGPVVNAGLSTAVAQVQSWSEKPIRPVTHYILVHQYLNNTIEVNH